MNIAYVLPGYIAGVISLAGLAFTIWMAHRRSEVDELDRCERKLTEALRDLDECRRERDSLQRQVYDLLERLYAPGKGGQA